MEVNKTEMALVAATAANEVQVVELSELQLALVGGGIADVVAG